METVKVGTEKFETISYSLKSNIRQYAMLIALIVIMAFFQIATGGTLLMPMNVTNLVLQNSYVLILAIGMTLCILTGGNIDLSVGSVAAFIAALIGSLIINHKMDVTQAIIIGLLVGVIIGIWQGYWISPDNTLRLTLLSAFTPSKHLVIFFISRITCILSRPLIMLLFTILRSKINIGSASERIH